MCLLFVCCIYAAQSQGLEYASAEWEKHLPTERLQYNYQYSGFTCHERKLTYRFFPTNSGLTGELRELYYQFHFENWDDIQENRNIVIRFPSSGRLTHLDYRIWQDGFIIYEAKPLAIERQIVDTIFDPVDGRICGLELELKELEPNSVVELYSRSEGIPIPFWLSFSDRFAVRNSKIELRIISADPFQYHSSNQVIDTAFRDYDAQVYRFKSSDIERQLNLGLTLMDTTKPYVALEWKDLILRYDRDKIQNWFDLLPYIFFQDEVKNYSVFINSEAESFGRSIYRGSLNEAHRYYRKRSENLQENFKQAWGRYTLYSSFVNPLVDLQEWVKEFADSAQLPISYGLKQVHAAMENYVDSRMEDLKLPPFEFTDYGLLSKFYTDYLWARGKEYYHVLMKAKRKGPFLDSLLSTRQFDAMGIGYNDEGGNFQFFTVGPYLGRFYAMNTIPADLSEGTMVIFNPDSNTYQTKVLPKVNATQNGFAKTTDVQVSFRYNFYRLDDYYRLRGLFSNKMYHAYLQSDTAVDVVSFTEFMLTNNAAFNQDKIEKKPVQIRMPEDSLALHIDLSEALCLKIRPHPAGTFAFPAPMQAEFFINIRCDKKFKLKQSSYSKRVPGVAILNYSWEKTDEKRARVKVDFQLLQSIVPSEKIDSYLQIDSLLRNGLTLEIIPDNES